ncbi:hypothetical protein [Stygiolobus caldivivus]|uniref:Uncharacterized protein n=1 Tax=Stygiolobus caldivivus TaxID=2824673 RepID=A0A8D5ZHG0_9CREN|nr:hypothetical protein [Stygiolobus caldivivus]BCU69659.1 hypothetical protein KN1_09560 [Stygiolobus caldivivus]
MGYLEYALKPLLKKWDMYLMVGGKLYGSTTVNKPLSGKLISVDKENLVFKIKIGGKEFSSVTPKECTSASNTIYDYVLGKSFQPMERVKSRKLK